MYHAIYFFNLTIITFGTCSFFVLYSVKRDYKVLQMCQSNLLNAKFKSHETIKSMDVLVIASRLVLP